jgi:hypothetical protein
MATIWWTVKNAFSSGGRERRDYATRGELGDPWGDLGGEIGATDAFRGTRRCMNSPASTTRTTPIPKNGPRESEVLHVLGRGRWGGLPGGANRALARGGRQASAEGEGERAMLGKVGGERGRSGAGGSNRGRGGEVRSVFADLSGRSERAENSSDVWGILWGAEQMAK